MIYHQWYFSSLVCICISIILFSSYHTYKASVQHIPSSKKKYKIGLLVMATGSRYFQAAQRMIESARTHFCTNHEVTYFVFTDCQVHATNADIIALPQKQLGWPYDTMMRFDTYNRHKSLLQQCDYLFSCDADMLFVNAVGDEIIGDRVATIHPQVRFRPHGYEDNPISTAYVKKGEATHYFAGAFYGGSRDQFFRLIECLSINIETDLSRGYIARVNDESHLNWYFAKNKPTIRLGPSYCHFEGSRSPYQPKLVALSSLDVEKKFMRKKYHGTPTTYYIKLLQSAAEAPCTL